MTLIDIYKHIGFDADDINGVYDGTAPRKDHSRQAVRARVDMIVHEAYGTVLDIGCSGGIVSILCARKGCEAVIGIDCYDKAIAHCEEMKSGEMEMVQRVLHFITCCAEKTTYRDETFDTVIAGQILEHVISPRVVLTEAMRVLKPGGKFLCSVPVGYNKTTTHLRFFEESNFPQLLGEFCDVMELENFADIQMLAICYKAE